MLSFTDAQIEAGVSRFQHELFALAVCLIGGDHDKAYDVATASCAEAAGSVSLFDKMAGADSARFRIRALGIVIGQCREIKARFLPDGIERMDAGKEEKKMLRLLLAALCELPFEARVLLLLRDQVHLAYPEICAVTRVRQDEARAAIEDARTDLRKKIEESLSRQG